MSPCIRGVPPSLSPFDADLCMPPSPGSPVAGSPRSRDSAATRERILEVAQALILEQGYAGTSVDSIVAGAGVTKGAFFHHFSSKADLASALLDRYATADAAHLESHMERAEKLATDPLQQLLVFVGLFEEEMAALTTPFPGCLYAAYTHEAALLDEASRATVRESFHKWRHRLGEKLEEVARRYPVGPGYDRRGLEDMMLTLFEGSFILSRVFGEPGMVAIQLHHLRQYLALLFSVEPHPSPRAP
jgi:TetR/AcrR family transcriptional regulator, transcriptional repressor for nem operon